jgi:hypothetical protein
LAVLFRLWQLCRRARPALSGSHYGVLTTPSFKGPRVHVKSRNGRPIWRLASVWRGPSHRIS